MIVRGTDDGERIPLTVADYDREQGTISIVIQAVGASTRKIVALEEGGALADFAGRSVSRRSSFTRNSGGSACQEVPFYRRRRGCGAGLSAGEMAA